MDMIAHSRHTLLKSIGTPARLRGLDEAQLPALADELPAYLNTLLCARRGCRAAGKGKRRRAALPDGPGFVHRATARAPGPHPPGALFEALGFEYFGPVDGHDLRALVPLLRALHRAKGPRLLHVVTRKGRGYAPAEADPVGYHSVGPFDPGVGVQAKSSSGPPSYTQVFGQWLCDMAGRDTRLTGITPAMREGSGLVDFARRFPQRYFDAGIAEQHAVTLEDNAVAGGAGSAVNECLAAHQHLVPVLNLGLADRFIDQGSREELLAECALDKAAILGAIRARLRGNCALPQNALGRSPRPTMRVAVH